MTDAFDDLNRRSLVLIGDEVVYRIGGALPGVALRVWLDQSDANFNFGNAAATAPDPTIELLVADVAAPSVADRIILPRGGGTYAPKTWPRSPDGRHWQMTLKAAL